MLYYLMNLHHGCKRIFMLRFPQDRLTVIQKYLGPVQRFLRTIPVDAKTSKVCVWTETSLVSYSIGEILKGHELLTKPQLRERELGVIEGLTKEEIQERYPEDYAASLKDPYYHHYARAESYHDVAVRLENVMMELEKEPEDVLIIADLSVLQCIYAYFREIPNRAIPRIKIETEEIVELRAKAYGIYERRIKLHAEEDEAGADIFHPFINE